MRRALFVGIDNYENAPLQGCVADARRMSKILQTHENGDRNFECKELFDKPTAITRASLRNAIKSLFQKPAQMALFYFSGHGKNVNTLGGSLITPDGEENEDGVSMDDVVKFANASPVTEIVIILDCCDSGAIADGTKVFGLKEGVSILTASGPQEAAMESNGRGMFTSLICDALEGGASDVLGEVNAASIYSYCDQSMGAWEQRPRFIANVSDLTALRMCEPEVKRQILRFMIDYFKSPDEEYKLDPSYEEDKTHIEDKTHNLEHERIFSHLQIYRAAHLLVPVGEDHLFYAALNSKSCKLTPLGRLYWRLVKAGRI